eukprot:COSAG03_NODE_208_length_10612_cov_35.757158_11_plen_187_part_00
MLWRLSLEWDAFTGVSTTLASVMDSGGGSREGFSIGEPVKAATARPPPDAATMTAAQAGQKLKALTNVRVSAVLRYWRGWSPALPAEACVEICPLDESVLILRLCAVAVCFVASAVCELAEAAWPQHRRCRRCRSSERGRVEGRCGNNSCDGGSQGGLATSPASRTVSALKCVVYICGSEYDSERS